MTHYMKLNKEAFEKIRSGLKTIELRLNDEKRQKISVGNKIVFKEQGSLSRLTAEVNALHKFKNFNELYEALPLNKCGYEDIKTAHPEDMLEYYSIEDIGKYGALGIELKNISAIIDVKACLRDNDFAKLLAYSVFNPTPEKLKNRAEGYINNESCYAIASFVGSTPFGLCIFEIKEKVATILDIAVDIKSRNKKIATALIDYIRYSFDTHEIVAETDNDAIGFYLKYGFVIAETTVKFDAKRYTLKYLLNL